MHMLSKRLVTSIRPMLTRQYASEQGIFKLPYITNEPMVIHSIMTGVHTRLTVENICTGISRASSFIQGLAGYASRVP